MNISPKSVRFDEYNMWVELSDARILGLGFLVCCMHKTHSVKLLS